MTDSKPGSTRDETFRGSVQGHTPDGGAATVIVTRQGLGRAGRVWLTFHGAMRTTVVLTDQLSGQLTGLLGDATQQGRASAEKG